MIGRWRSGRRGGSVGRCEAEGWGGGVMACTKGAISRSLQKAQLRPTQDIEVRLECDRLSAEWRATLLSRDPGFDAGGSVR